MVSKTQILLDMILKRILTLTLLAFCSAFILTDVNAQCEIWTGTPQEEAATEAHSIYRQALKSKDYDLAFENWEKAYNVAPAADGKRDFHFTDGIILYKEKFKTATEEEKKAIVETVLGLYDDAVTCLNDGTIKFKDVPTDVRVNYHLGNKVFDMFYTFNTLYSKTYAATEMAVESAGNDVDYRVFVPYATVAVDHFIKEKIDKVKARAIHDQLVAIADHNVANNEQLGAYYGQQKVEIEKIFARIKHQIFDCEYFMKEYKPMYEADPTNPEVVKTVYNKLKSKKCAEDDPFLMKLKKQYETWAAKENANKQATFEANNPAMMANKAYKAGDFNTALSKYKEALATETSPEKQANYHMSIASILFRKMNKMGEARTHARKAASLKANWGKPYMLIGDMYAKSSRSCGGGDAYKSGVVVLAAISKWAKAKSIDPSVADDAQSKINKYNQYIPESADAFMLGKKAGATVSTGCWVGEKVTLRVK
jgi:tetratricopeptide (TPR) repeat protein